MKESIKLIRDDKIILISCITSLILIAINSGYIALSYSHLPPFVPLFNQMAWGDPRVGTKQQIFIPGGIGLTCLLCNLILSILIHKKIPLVSRMLCFTTLLICFLTLLLVIRTVQITI